MSETKVVSLEDPEYYAELLKKAHGLADRRLTANEQLGSCSVPGIQNVDHELSQRLQTLLDVIADISLCRRGNVSATMASLKIDEGTPGSDLETQLYIIFNYEDESSGSCAQHLESIFNMLCELPYKPPTVEGSENISNELEDSSIEIYRAVHNYSFDIFTYRVSKRKRYLSDICRYIEQGRPHFTDEQYSTLVVFLEQVEAIVQFVTNAQAMEQLPTSGIKMLLKVYSYWRENNILPGIGLAHNHITLLDLADNWLAENHKIGFQLRRWALKFMSFVISTDRLLIQTQSCRLRKLFEGKFLVKVLDSLPTTPYCCDLSSKAIKQALETVLAGTRYLSEPWNRERESFIQWLADPSMAVRKNTTVHAELAMIKTMVSDGKMKDVLPYIGVSKLSCIMCSHYIRAFNKVMEEKIVTKGSHGKTYPGWFWPGLPDRDEDIRAAFLRRIKEQVSDDFATRERPRRLSDSSVGSDAPGRDFERTLDEVIESLDTVASL